MLEVQEIDVYYGAIHALKKLSISVEEGSIVTLIGANGAGKTTTLKTISGLLRPRSGSIKYKNQELTNVPPEKIVGLGICHLPEGRRVYPSMNVMENLEMGAYLRKDKKQIIKIWIMYLNVSTVKREIQANGRYFERRRTANAGHRTCFNGQAGTVIDGRTLYGVGSAVSKRNL